MSNVRSQPLFLIDGGSVIELIEDHADELQRLFLNSVLKKFPPEVPTASELQAYLSNEASTWAIVHGFRYIAFGCIVFFAAGLFSRTCCTRTNPTTGWGVVGLLGTAVFVTNGVITNGIQMLAFLNIDLLSQQQDLFWLLFRLTRVLFTAEIVTWSFLIFGFSIAGWRSTTIPKWLAALGLFSVAAGMLTGGFIVSVVSDGWAAMLAEVAALTGLAWFACIGIYMLIRGESQNVCPKRTSRDVMERCAA